MSKAIARTVDPLKASYKNLLAVTFTKSSSPSYQIAVSIAQGATQYEELVIGRKPVHFAVFAKTREDAGRAQTLLDYIRGWRGVQIFAGGKLIQNTWQVTQVLQCFLEASGSDDWTAHCHKIIDDPCIVKPEIRGASFTISLTDKPSLKKAMDIDRFAFPCAFLHQRFRFQPDHPATPQAQIQAAGVATGCDWCPNFKPSEYKKIGTRTVIEDVFK